MKIARLKIDDKIYSGFIEEKYLITKEGAIKIENAKWLPPCEPSKIIGLALNFKEHAEELGLSITEDPIIFLKPNNTLVGHLENIIYPKGAKFVHYEGELAVVIGSRCRNVKESEAMNYVLGYTIANDVTARDFITSFFRPPIKAKGFDTFLPLGPFIVTRDEIGEETEFEIITKVNGELKQKGNTRSFIHPIPKVIAFLSSFMTLYPGDVILMGTPRGISPLKPNDLIEITIDKIGTLTNKIVEEN
ncbi:MAG: fumarylacetoacetate hydrolase family protein [Thermoproteota archaeon]|jgi:5-oxopent-3-ene-1,2,5-tricarboxylate decarboxylase/2-hydroxyhepta-2,4-diene-1,7-dioate isomerase|nr:fumarylacetoacetate hydrolase family protein [Thermoproteota archaeon]